MLLVLCSDSLENINGLSFHSLLSVVHGVGAVVDRKHHALVGLRCTHGGSLGWFCGRDGDDLRGESMSRR